MHVVEIFSSVASLSIIIEYVQLSSEGFKSMIGSIVILAGGKCVPTDTSLLKPAQLLLDFQYTSFRQNAKASHS